MITLGHIRKICTDHGVPVPRIERGMPGRGLDGVCLFGVDGPGRSLIVVRSRRDDDVVLHELAHHIVPSDRQHGEEWLRVFADLMAEYCGWDPVRGRQTT